ncbi:plasmid pRiA4b ORF-3 family protein [Neobacillus dielmonensis]|uniref:plasmid pRiA4b ORF-3 family protein n=1 Tax=Neobacillus dielmonensis TaxID=1347369 RepID=UPI000AF46BC3|nr:plasmid pRiA4b ORF-3 family protein [Neobacillus dielmonensis]
MNDSNRYVIVLYGLTATNLKKIDDCIFEGIRETLREEGIKEEIIKRFLLDSGKMTFTMTKNRTTVSRLNKACESVYYHQELLNENTIFSTELSKSVSREWVGEGKNSYIRPREEMYKDLENFAGEPIFSMRAAQVKVTLKLENHPVWRQIMVPLYGTFANLHEILQTAFGWKDNHLHEFYIFEEVPASGLGGNHNLWLKPIINLVCDEKAFAYPKEIERKLEKDVKLSDWIPAYRRFRYTYDFSDNWEHELEVEKVIDYKVNTPICLSGEGNIPPEDVGGEFGFEEFLAILGNPTHPEHKHMKQWGIMQGYKDFDLERVNRILKNR